jgi:hypothetical protein
MLLPLLQNLWMLGRRRGGHFGFDDKARDSKWLKERESENGRKRLLEAAIAKLTPKEQEAAKEIIAAPLAIVAVSVERFDRAILVMDAIDDDEEISELFMLGVL